MTEVELNARWPYRQSVTPTPFGGNDGRGESAPVALNR